MIHELAGLTIESHEGGPSELRIGVGVNAGQVTLGTVGSSVRMDCGVAGDAVNLAARVEGLTKPYGAALLISHHVVERLDDPEEFTLRRVDKVAVKGRARPVDLFQVLEAEPAERAEVLRSTLGSYRAGIRHYYDARFTEAGRRFAECLVRDPHDQNALSYLARCRRHMGGVPSGWSGVEVLGYK